jgi:hypothetical protein
MCAYADCLTKITDSQLFAAVIGALIGIFPAQLISAWHEKRKDRQAYAAWLNGLLAELNHIDGCITEITQIVQKGIPSTKRMNSDFVKQCRLTLFGYDKDVGFLQCLTNTYRDIVHTNDMLDRFEKMAQNHNSLQPNVLASMKGVGASVSCLKCKVEAKLKTK